jgi:hypothetical protein
MQLLYLILDPIKSTSTQLVHFMKDLSQSPTNQLTLRVTSLRLAVMPDMASLHPVYTIPKRSIRSRNYCLEVTLEMTECQCNVRSTRRRMEWKED